MPRLAFSSPDRGLFFANARRRKRIVSNDASAAMNDISSRGVAGLVNSTELP